MDKISWKEIYSAWHWEADCCELRSTMVKAEDIYVKCKKDEIYICGYDWIKKEDKPSLYVDPQANGIARTAQMLAEAKNEEEQAAVWIAATARYLFNYSTNVSVLRCAEELYGAVHPFLESKFCLWSASVRKVLPDMMIPKSVLNSVSCEDIYPVLGLIVMNTVLLKNEYKILRCFSSDAEKASLLHPCRKPNHYGKRT